MPAPVGPQVEAYRRYYQDCVAHWSDERYALDTRFVQLTLLLDQGEDAQGLRWQRGSETLHDLSEVLARVSEPAVVVLGPPGSGKSTRFFCNLLTCQLRLAKLAATARRVVRLPHILL